MNNLDDNLDDNLINNLINNKLNKKIPLRKCVACQQMLDKSTLIRVVKTPDKEYLIDISGKMSGRGAYVCKTISCFEKAQKSKGFERSFKTGLSKDIYENLKSELF